jgi:hypothetical protein
MSTSVGVFARKIYINGDLRAQVVLYLRHGVDQCGAGQTLGKKPRIKEQEQNHLTKYHLVSIPAENLIAIIYVLST